MDKNRLEYLAKRYFNDSCSSEELKELAALIKRQTDDISLKNALESIWESFEPVQPMPEDISERIIADVFSTGASAIATTTERSPGDHLADSFPERSVSRKLRTWKYAGVAASIALIWFAGWFVWKNNKPGIPAKQHTISAKKGSRLKVTLTDGTTVWLNAGSTIAYDSDFDREDRRVILSGEAYFDVAHNEHLPFIIHTPSMDVKVLGTEFTVRAYPDEKKTEASLITGSLEVSFPGRSKDKVILSPSEKISVDNVRGGFKDNVTSEQPAYTGETTEPEITRSTITRQPGDSLFPENSWINNKMIFRNKLFEEAAHDLARWYDVQFEFRDSAIIKKRFTATFEDESIMEALNRLAESYSFPYTYDTVKKVVTIGN